MITTWTDLYFTPAEMTGNDSVQELRLEGERFTSACTDTNLTEICHLRYMFILDSELYIVLNYGMA